MERGLTRPAGLRSDSPGKAPRATIFAKPGRAIWGIPVGITARPCGTTTHQSVSFRITPRGDARPCRPCLTLSQSAHPRGGGPPVNRSACGGKPKRTAVPVGLVFSRTGSYRTVGEDLLNGAVAPPTLGRHRRRATITIMKDRKAREKTMTKGRENQPPQTDDRVQQDTSAIQRSDDSTPSIRRRDFMTGTAATITAATVLPRIRSAKAQNSGLVDHHDPATPSLVGRGCGEVTRRGFPIRGKGDHLAHRWSSSWSGRGRRLRPGPTPPL